MPNHLSQRLTIIFFLIAGSACISAATGFAADTTLGFVKCEERHDTTPPAV